MHGILVLVKLYSKPVLTEKSASDQIIKKVNRINLPPVLHRKRRHCDALLTFPGFCERDIVAISSTIADEGVLSLAVGVPAGRSRLRVSPVEVTTGALGAGKSDRLKNPRRVILLRVGLELGPCQSFDLLQNSQAKRLSNAKVEVDSQYHVPWWRDKQLCR